ncbi:ABSCISIC ACID-INSENSITIVE 5-like protein 5 [Salvia splendens]|uniref:ABSCISIC ACID-INSENSITIVE 5-like protein 5 n=1 Tax=Salvia splendens TaxID=180675 RepID=UPI001C260E01|nr:ABSCISIC ACID-INSENSITIVE 5-like protein 5 [Salvia splendens]XP_042046873.1 ABSCISIC ACID-INSENSITIVE 5-like protein 5 [Salvia splendens]
MGSTLNFKNFGNEPPAGGGGGRPPNNSPLARQSSVYSLTFDEFQNTIGGSGKDFGSMNMDELLKSIWSAEDNHNLGPAIGGGTGGQEGGGLQRQGSLILPRTLSQKTVDEVWRDMSKEGAAAKEGAVTVASFGMPQRQQTLGEITLEEFLERAGVVREEAQLAAANNAGIFGDLWHPVNNSSGMGFGFQQQQQQEASRNLGLIGVGVNETSNQIAAQPAANSPLNVNGVRSAAQQMENHPLQQQQQRQQHQHQQILPKQSGLAYGSAMGIPTNGQLSSPRIRGGMVGISNPVMNNSPAHNPALQGGGLDMVGLVSNGSPAVSSDGLLNSNGDTSSVSPVPYVFNGCLRGRKSAALEKVVERRQKRMIKNRESAARSRARKQAYNMELEEEVAKLKEEKEQLQKKQDEMIEMQKNQALELIKLQNGTKRQCLRRTQTGPW